MLSSGGCSRCCVVHIAIYCKPGLSAGLLTDMIPVKNGHLYTQTDMMTVKKNSFHTLTWFQSRKQPFFSQADMMPVKAILFSKNMHSRSHPPCSFSTVINIKLSNRSKVMLATNFTSKGEYLAIFVTVLQCLMPTLWYLKHKTWLPMSLYYPWLSRSAYWKFPKVQQVYVFFPYYTFIVSTVCGQ